MKTCVFFGDRQPNEADYESLLQAIRYAIEEEHIQNFYVGDRGFFAGAVSYALRSLKEEYPDITYSIILYTPLEDELFVYSPELREYGFFPEELRSVPFAYAIGYRDRWMVEHADMVICYLYSGYGGEASAVCAAENRRLKILYLANYPQNNWILSP